MFFVYFSKIQNSLVLMTFANIYIIRLHEEKGYNNCDIPSSRVSLVCVFVDTAVNGQNMTDIECMYI